MKNINATVVSTHNSPGAKRGTIRWLALLAVWLAVVASTPYARAAGNVLPPMAQPLSWTIDDMAAAIANFSASGNDPAFYPDTPFQIIYRHPGNAFVVSPGTWFFVKVFYIDDSAPIIGDWPADKDAVQQCAGRRLHPGQPEPAGAVQLPADVAQRHQLHGDVQCV